MERGVGMLLRCHSRPEGSDKRRIAYLQVIGGKDVRTIFKTMVFETAADKKIYAKVLEKFDALCLPVRNTICERFNFHRRNQSDTETFAMYMEDLRRLGTHCDFANLTEDQIYRDKGLLGMRDKILQRKLLEKKELTLDKLMTVVKIAESTKNQWSSMNKDEEEVGI